jgi:hypothetical protein
MIPIKWDNSGNPVVTVTSDSDWYDYENKKWANAMTLDGSMWVWIPRYEYKITTPHTNIEQTINVNLLKGKNKVATSGYTVHPAFTFGDEELNGIWVAKFEASGTTSSVDIKPSKTSLRSNTISNIFTACRNMETNNRYGWGTSGSGIDTHLFKNIEWGAVAYLSQSIYGKNSEVWINSNNKYLTGHAGSSASSNSNASTSEYNNKLYGINASTTGNEYGIYDMSGGAYEYTAAYVNNGNTNLNKYGASLVSAEDKYKDIYLSGSNQNNTYIANFAKKGDAVYETSSRVSGAYSWYNDYSYMPYSSNVFFVRGNVYSSRTSAGIFAFYYRTGSSSSAYGFRPSLVVSN